MARIAFVQNEYEDKLGILYIIAYLKSKGHEADVFITENKTWFDEVKGYSPDALGFSTLTGGHLWVESCVEEIKRFKKWDIPIIVGGTHPTFFPDCIENPCIDFICRGEGEYPMEDFMNCLENGGNLNTIQNIWGKKDGCIIQNDVRPLIEDLDNLPIPDRSHYRRYPFLRNNPHKKIITSRGCPFSCTYCYNSAFKNLYRGKGKLVRRVSVPRVMDELMHLKDQFGWKTLEIVDDAFLSEKKWFIDFADHYSRNIALPYACFSIINNIDRDVAQALKSSGCKCILFGVEAGSERVRKDIYKKRISNKQIIRGAEELHRAGLSFLTFNMVGAPTETLQEMEETIQINQEIKTDHPWCSIMQPYPGTEIYDYCIKNDLLDRSSEIRSFTYFEECILKYTPHQLRQIKNIQKLFFVLVKWPLLYRCFYRVLIHFPFSQLYTPVFYACYAYSLNRRYDIRFRHLLKYWIKLKTTRKLSSLKN